MLGIKKRNKEWRLTISEEWAFKTKKEFDECLKKLVEYKDKFGNLSEHNIK